MKNQRSGVAVALSAGLMSLVTASQAQAVEDPPPMSVRATGLRVATIPVEGMVCLSCAASIKKAVRKVEGVTDAEIDFVHRSLRVTYASGKILLLGRVNTAIVGLGYKPGTPVLEP